MTKEVEKLIEVKLRPDDWRKITDALSLYGWMAFDFGNKKEHQYVVWLKGVIDTRIWEESEPGCKPIKLIDGKPIPISEKDLPF